MFTIFVAILIAKQSMNLLPRVFRYALWERHSNFYHIRVAHKYWREVRFPMLFGMGPVSWLSNRPLHPNMYTGWVRSKFQCSPHMLCIAFYSLFFPHYSSQPPFNFLGIIAQNNAFKAHNDSIAISIPALKYWMSNSGCSRKYSLRIPSHRGLCPSDYYLCP